MNVQAAPYVGRKNEKTCTSCRRPFNAWDSEREKCYLCGPRPTTPVESQIRCGDMTEIRL